MKKRGLSLRGFFLIWMLALLIVAGCDKTTDVVAPPDFEPLIDVLELTPLVDSGSPVPLEADGDLLAVLYTSIFGGSGDIYRLMLTDSNADGYYDSFDLKEFYPNENDSSEHFSIPAHEQFTFIGAYEIVSDGVGGDTLITNYPGNTYFSGPRHLSYNEYSDRIYYSMGYEKVSQISSTVSPRDANLGHTGEIVNNYDTPLEEIFSYGIRAPIWDLWYTKVFWNENYAFTGGHHASVTPLIEGQQWLAYADTLLQSFDRDGYDSHDSELAGEDPEGAIEVVEGELPDDGAPGYLGEDDDSDGLADFEDVEVAAMMATGVPTDPPAEPSDWTAAWSMQYYVPAWDDDEDGLMDEDLEEIIDNDGDGLFNEDPREPEIDNDGDGQTNEDPPNGIDDDEDGLIDEDGPEEQIDNDGDGELNEDGPDYIDTDNDGEIDEDGLGDMNGDGYPGWVDIDDDEDEFADDADPQVRHSVLRAANKEDYDPALDDDEDGISDEDGDLYRNGLWVVRLGEGGLPDETSVPISLTNDGGRQPYFNPDGNDLLYVLNGDIMRLSLDYTAETVTATGTENLTNSVSLEAYPAYSYTGDRIVYCSSFHGSSDVWLMNADGSTTRVTNFPGQELYPRFTPDGNQILFEAWLHPSGERRVMITLEELP